MSELEKRGDVTEELLQRPAVRAAVQEMLRHVLFALESVDITDDAVASGIRGLWLGNELEALLLRSFMLSEPPMLQHHDDQENLQTNAELPPQYYWYNFQAEVIRSGRFRSDCAMPADPDRVLRLLSIEIGNEDADSEGDALSFLDQLAASRSAT